MQTWCIYIDESGVPHGDGQPNFVYAAICVPFNSQQEFLKSYPEIVNPLTDDSGEEIKYGPLLNTRDECYKPEIGQICKDLLTYFFHIKDARIIRVKAKKKQMRLKGNALRVALFGKTLELCKNILPTEHQAMILHDELPPGNQQNTLLERFNGFNKDSPGGLNFQNCVFVQSNENPLMQFADFVASICYRYYYFQQKEYRNKRQCASLVDSLFKTIDKHYPPIVELSGHTVVEHTVVEGNPRRKQALKLASEHDILPETAYQIVDKRITLDEVLRRKQARASKAYRQNEDKGKILS